MMSRLIISIVWLLAVLGAAGVSAAQGEPGVSDGDLVRHCAQHLETWRIAEARRDADEFLKRHPNDATAHAMGAHVAFMESDYAECRRHLEALKKLNVPLPEGISGIVEKLKPVHDSFHERRSEHFRLRWAHPADAVLAEYAMPMLEKALGKSGKAFGYEHMGEPMVVEVYPDIESFAAASTLTVEEIRTSGAAGICKFNRIMVLSPRLLVQGYRWCDALAHELIHFIVIRRTAGGIPVWLHEGIAKHYDQLWRRDAAAPLCAAHTTLLAEAREKNHFITFEQMHPSLAKLSTQQDVALAFAEVDSFIEFLEDKSGPKAVVSVLDAVAGGRPVEAALADVTGMPLKDLHAAWLQWLGARKLDRIPGLRLFPRAISEGPDNTEKVSDLANVFTPEAYKFIRLGDMLMDEDKVTAAAVEYGRAADRTTFLSPHLHVRMARARSLSGDYAAAGRALDEVARYYEDYLPTYIARAEMHLEQGQKAQAMAALEEAMQINPFDPRPHQVLIGLYGDAGRQEERAREERALKLIGQWLGW